LFVLEILVTTDTRVYMQPNEIVTFRLHLSLHAEVHLNDLQTLYPFMTRKETHNGDTRGK
jgi:hypothetical protein